MVLIPGAVRTQVTFYGRDSSGNPQWLDLQADVRDDRVRQQFGSYDKQKGVAAKLPCFTSGGLQWKTVWLTDLVGTGWAEDGATRGYAARFRAGLPMDQLDRAAIEKHGVAFELHSQSLGAANPAPVQAFGQNSLPVFKQHSPYNIPLPASRAGWWQVHVGGKSWLFDNPRLAQQRMQEAYDAGQSPYAVSRYRGPDSVVQRSYPFATNPLGPTFR